MSLVVLYIAPYIILFSKETRALNCIVAKHDNLEYLRKSLTKIDYYCFDPYIVENDMLAMNVSYKSNRPFVDLLFVWIEIRFRISPASYLVYADKDGNILSTDHAGGIVF